MPYRLLAVFNQGATGIFGAHAYSCHPRLPQLSVQRGRVARRERTLFRLCSIHQDVQRFVECEVASADTARPPAGLEHLYGSHMHTQHTSCGGGGAGGRHDSNGFALLVSLAPEWTLWLC